MKKQLAAIVVLSSLSMAVGAPGGAGAGAGAAEAQPASVTQGPASPVIAKVGDAAVTLDQLERPLIEGYGLNVLLNLVQLEIAKQSAARAGAKITPDDIAKEREQTIEHMFRDSNEKLIDRMNTLRSKNQTADADKIAEQIKTDNQQAFEQFLQNQHISRAEFDIVTETNAYLRKIAEPMLVGKISEDNLHQAFNTLYGETVKCRHIQCANLTEIQEAKQRLAAGQPFAKVAQEMSRNGRTAPIGGELPAFSLQAPGLPQEFKDAAFALKEGQVSEIVQADGAYHLILLEKRIAPKAVKFEDVKESVRADLMDKAVQATVTNLRQQLAEQARTSLTINDPTLKKQWDDRLAKASARIKDREEMKKQMDLERERAATQPAPSDLAPPGLVPRTEPAK